MMRLILFLMISLLFSGSARPPSSLLATIEAPFRQVALEHQTVRPGHEQNLSVTLDHRAAITTIFQLTIFYPDGETQTLFRQTVGSTATLSWLVPTDVKTGMARFRLTTSGCGCGDPSGVTSLINLESSAEGYFFVQE
jgi:hypothetical protein